MTESGDTRFEDAPPDPGATIESLGALGYSPESAIADLVDNSISAGARHVQVFMHWDGAETWCAVVDDGSGMTERVLRQAMRIGSTDPLQLRASSDLGRFGFGLKTASFSQSRELTVATRPKARGRLLARCWDLDHVRETGRWELLTSAPSDARAVIEQVWPRGVGTVVVWRRLRGALVEEYADASDVEAQSHFLARVKAVESHLAMTFGRFLTRTKQRLSLTVNDREVVGWDPLLSDNPATQCRPEERLILRGQTMRVAPAVLPHPSKLTDAENNRAAGPAGWNEQQGFYVYRADRLIQAGGWFTLHLSRDDNHNLARIAVDVPPALDHDWSLDVRKASVRPPGPLIGDLRKIAIDTRRVASAVYRHRGVVTGVSTKDRRVEPVWKQVRKHDQLTFRINRSHPLIDNLLEEAGGARGSVVEIFRLIEETVPIPVLPGVAQPETHQAFETESDSAILDLVSKTYESLLRKGLSRLDAARRLSRIEPFNQYPELVTKVTGFA